MTGPIDTAYQAFVAAVRAALEAKSFIVGTAVEVDPSAPYAPTGDETVLVTAAAVLNIDTKSVQTFLGGPYPRYVVERTASIELAAAGPDDGAVKQAVIAAATACADIVKSNEHLGGAVERLRLTDRRDDDLPPNGAKLFLSFTLRVRALDPLGMT